ncbi:shikimate dehydrogenase [Frigoribacterium sp. CG_9.8]|uniref:shikimate dehydrogenase n=1 Tax=Frigoribacterium sp. CG_9.8 TaxID=2787733 RepID=UPI001A1A164A|nr:shikimate dehydrogenase [Frigoribacterium sp. CG_9.8]MBG6108065.1 shikimate dehydrogenase [Frigoribacterium sp. CG_9.8]
MTQLGVLGSPIGHSQSPALHRAAYRVLRLDWQYEAIEVDAAGLAGFIGSRGPDWRGLSLTMPLKHEVMALLDVADPLAKLTGAANTLLFHHEKGDWSLRGFNTDVPGIVEAFRGAGISHLGTVRILGAGATAASALVAVAELGARLAVVSARSAHALSALLELGNRLGIDVQASRDDDSVDARVPDAVISTLPGGADHHYHFDSATRASAVLFDVAYDPWPSPLAARWLDAGGRVIPGIEMLVNQALFQVRIFVGGGLDRILPRESAVLAAMRESVGL